MHYHLFQLRNNVFQFNYKFVFLYPTLPQVQTSSSSSPSGPEAYASDAPQPAGNPETPVIFGRTRFRRQAPPRPHDARDPSSERWNLWARIVR